MDVLSRHYHPQRWCCEAVQRIAFEFVFQKAMRAHHDDRWRIHSWPAPADVVDLALAASLVHKIMGSHGHQVPDTSCDTSYDVWLFEAEGVRSADQANDGT